MYGGSFMQFRCRILVIFVNYLWNLLECDRELYFKSPINIHGKLDAPSLIKYKVTPSGVELN